MTAVNAGVHELTGVRLPLQPYPGRHAVFMYSTASDGNVTLQLKEPDDLDRNSLAAMLARLQDDATLSISYQDTDILSDGSIDVLLGTGTANSGGGDAVTATFDLFDSSSGPDLTLSPQTFTNSAEAFINDNSNSLGVPADSEAVTTTTTTEEKKPTTTTTTSTDNVKLAVKRPRPKAASPNRQGPQQCQVCAKVFGNASALAKHKLTHSDERKYVCSMCGKAFKRQDHLNGHMLTHRNKKPYECKAEGCGKSYCDARSLRRHTENHHSSSTTTIATTTMSPAQGAASGDAASPHGSSCIQYAPPPTSTSQSTTNGKSQLQQLLATDPVKSGNSGNNDGLTKQQLDLIHQIMEQTQRQSQSTSKPVSKPTTKLINKTPAKVQRVWNSNSQQNSSNKSNGNSASSTNSQTKVTTTTTTSSTNAAGNKPEQKPVECNLCHRKFKNIPALNGHMRLHGGYFKKDAENKKCEKKDNTGPPLQTASVSVRALIEEKIINKRITNPATATASTSTTDDTKCSNAPPLFPITVHSSANSNELDTKSFVVPAPPQQTPEKTRRHSDAETFNRSSNTQQEAQALADLILKREKASVKRTTSDPGQTSQLLQFQSNDSFTLANVTYQPDAEYLSPTLQDEVFTQVQDSMLLSGVDPQQLASIQFQADSLLQEQNVQNLQDISLDDYANLQDQVDGTGPFRSRHNQELQAVLDSPLPESLAEFSTFHSTNNIDIQSPNYQTHSPAQYSGSPHTSLTAQSPLQSPLIRHDSPGFAYPTPPASHEGQSPCFGQNSLLPLVSPKQEFGVVDRMDEPSQPSSPLSAAFFTPTMSSSAAVEEALEEVLPGESISADDLYPLTNFTNPQSPLGLTPVPSPISNIVTSSPSTTYTSAPNPTTTFPLSSQYTLQSHMLPTSDDPLLSSSPKDFVTKRRFEFNGIPLKLITNNQLLDLNNSNFAGILVDANGELKFIQTSGNAFPSRNIVLANTHLISSSQEHGTDDKIKVQRVVKTVQYTIPTKPAIVRPKQEVNKKDDSNDVFLSPTTIPSSPIRVSRKRPRTEPLHLPVLHQSKLRATRSKPQGSAPFTPQPILNPQRPGTGLYSHIKSEEGGGGGLCNEPVPESDSTPHINVGANFQCTIPPLLTTTPNEHSRESTHEDLLWDPGINHCTDNEVDMYLDFACCAAVPGGGRNKEYAMHLLHMCSGNIHDAMLRLMQPTPILPADHPLLCYTYTESDKWSIHETELFLKALLKYDKDFHTIAQEIRSKCVKQCVQFYYVWKKVCPDEYRRLKHVRERRNNNYYKNAESEQDEKVFPDSKLMGIVDSGSPMPVQETRHFACEFPDCSASFNSRAALNGHIRIHGGTARSSPTPTNGEKRSSASVSSTVCHADSTEDYPCKICGKVFSKIKSRSAHMKSHRPPDAEPSSKRKENKEITATSNVHFEVSVPSPFST